MKKYQSLIDQTFEFPTPEFHLQAHSLFFNNIDIMSLVKEHGTPLKISYLPKIAEKIEYARSIFRSAFEKYGYEGDYTYCYCTKSSHFSFVLDKVLENGAHLETSSTYDIEIIKNLYKNGKLNKEIMLICNGYKMPRYTEQIADLLNDGFKNCIPILDNLREIDYYKQHVTQPYKVGIRVASDEEPNFDFYTSRLGVRYSSVVDLYRTKIANDPNIQLKTVHFFINSGIRDSAYYWTELSKFVYKYCELKKFCPHLDTIDIGGGFPIKTALDFDFDYGYMAEQIVENIQIMCKQMGVDEPNIITEFGNYTVGESGAVIYSVMDAKLQNDKELWYMLDGSFITQMPDTWAKNQKFIVMAINNWERDYQQVHLGGITCDSDDFYNSEANNMSIFMPKKNNDPQYIGFFHTGAYQESIGGYGGLQHCLIPGAKHLVIDRGDGDGLEIEVFREQQGAREMLDILGYS